MPKRPWMYRKPGESTRSMNARLNKTCVQCGREFPTMLATDIHELACLRQPAKRRTKK